MHKLAQKIEALGRMSPAELRCLWRDTFKQAAPDISPDLMGRAIAYRWQERQHGGLPAPATRDIARLTRLLVRTGTLEATDELSLKPGTRLVRDWNGRTLNVLVCEKGFELDGRRYGSLTQIAQEVTGTRWSGPRFFGLKKRKAPPPRRASVDA
ncbi:DUF2924 domain-containing protein [uncultured Sphingomonas sp.]|uniref:DUF2924 domain-containing protein n=1 Tax=uncultured Sphingomonas sp. TaxID=158754 RepID=UPI0025E9E3DB|nr:DUF2924 domain-containing protein [uncultured Sphingomonas sp.]